MSDSESDIAFESADEGEELLHSVSKASQNSNTEVDINKLYCCNKDGNGEEEKTCKRCEKGMQCICTPEKLVSTTDIINCTEQSEDLNFKRKTSSEDDDELKIVQDSNRENISCQLAADADSNEYLIESKYTTTTCTSEKQTETTENYSSDNRTERPDCVLEYKKNQSTHSDGCSNFEKQCGFSENVISESKKEKTERVVLKLEKRLSEKSKYKSDSTQHKSVKTVLKEEVTDFSKTKEQHNSSWGWGNWSSSLLATAASSVSAFTSQVSEGFGTVLETVESTLGAPPPEELAAAIESRKKEVTNCGEKTVTNEIETSINTEENSGLLDGVSSLSKVIENTSSKVLMTGLDALELIGKTTIDILTEGDPGLRKKRAYFKEATNLSEILREAKDKAEAASIVVNASEIKTEEAVHYSTFFDNFQGIVHLEALEMLSKQNKTALQGWLLSQNGENVRESKERINELQEMCENLPAVDDAIGEEKHHAFASMIKDYTKKLELDVDSTKLEKVHKDVHEWLKNCQKEQDKGEVKDAANLHHEALKSMASLTACSMELFHRIAEMILYKSPEIISAVSCASCLIDITSVLCSEVGLIAVKFCHCLNTAADDSEDPDSIAPLITDVYLEASNSSTYIQDAFQLLVPILQMVAIKQNE